MSIKELIKTLLEKDSYELLIWLQFLATKKDCRECIQAMHGIDKLPNCSDCIPASNLIRKSKKLLEKGDKRNGTKNHKKRT